MHGSNGLEPSFQTGLAGYYLFCALLNAGFAWYYARKGNTLQASIWGAVTALFLFHAGAYAAHVGWALPRPMRDLIDTLANPVSYFVGSLAAFVVFVKFRKFCTEPYVAWALLNLLLLFSGWSMTDPSFQSI